MKFSVVVSGEDGEAVKRALAAAGLPTMGSAATGYGAGEVGRVGKSVIAIVDAVDAEHAEAIVTAAVSGAEGEFTLSDVREWHDQS